MQKSFGEWIVYFFIISSETELLLVRSSSSGGADQNAIMMSSFSTISPAALLHLSKVDTNYFDSSAPRNVTALVGKSAYLGCRIRPSLNRTLNTSKLQVSWIRHRDIHILTVGSYTYTSDQRFQANHETNHDQWTLQIKWAQRRDAGIYECQLSTQPVRSYFVNLNVVVPTATILGGPDLHVDKGSTINLTCIIENSPEPPAYIFWYHHDEAALKNLGNGSDIDETTGVMKEYLGRKVISYDSQRGGVSVITEKGDTTTSFLLIQNAVSADSGKYSCSPSNAEVASVRVHVLDGERPAAMQTGSAHLANSSLNICLTILLILLYNNLYTHEYMHLFTFLR